MADERVIVTVDCATGEEQVRTETPDERKAREERQAQAVQAEADRPPTVEDRFEAFLARVEAIPETATAAQTRDGVKAAAAQARRSD